MKLFTFFCAPVANRITGRFTCIPNCLALLISLFAGLGNVHAQGGCAPFSFVPLGPSVFIPPPGSSPEHLVIRDFNGDGRPDMAVASAGTNTIAILLGSVFGGFGGGPLLNSVGTGAKFITAGDINLDGLIDIVVTNQSGNNCVIYKGQGNGSFAPLVNITTGLNAPASVAVNDFNGDGKPDLAITNQGANSISIFAGNGFGAFIPLPSFVTLIATSRSVLTGDFNGDGKADLVVTASAPNSIVTFLGNGSGGFTSSIIFPFPFPISASPQAMVSGDFNGDGKADLVVASTSSNNFTILMGLGTGAFAPSLTIPGNTGITSLAISDFNGDGKQDVAAVNSSNIAVFVGTGTGSFIAKPPFSKPGPTTSIGAGDFNMNGTNDLVTTTTGASSTYNVFLNTCGVDTDADGILDVDDNCPNIPNPDQLNTDGDAQGNACDADDDNDGVADVSDCAPVDRLKWQTAFVYIDNDMDGFINGSTFLCYGSVLPWGYTFTKNFDDCDDNNPSIHAATIYFRDADGDGFGNRNDITFACSATPPDGYVYNSIDCDDTHATYVDGDGDGYGGKFGSKQPCGVPNNTDCNDQDPSIHAPQTFYADVDRDGFGDRLSPIELCQSTVPFGYVTNDIDCDDTRLSFIDNDGDGYGSGSPVPCGNVSNCCDCDDHDPNVHEQQTFYRDRDGDGFGTAFDRRQFCLSDPPPGYVANSLDCDDDVVTYADNDLDGYGAGDPVPCGVADHTDCDDGDPSIHSVIAYYRDADGDGFGTQSDIIAACSTTPPDGYVTNANDCDDTQATYSDFDGDGYGNKFGGKVPCGVPEHTDCNDQDPSIHAEKTFYADVDGDGFGDLNYPTTSCSAMPPAGFVTNSSDCNDHFVTYADVDQDGFGSNTKVPCGGVSNHTDCNDNLVMYQDNDHDGYGSTIKVPCNGVTNSFDSNDSDGKQLIYVCHKGTTMVVNANGAQAHVNHGDNLGPCTSTRMMNPVLIVADKVPAAVYPNPSNGVFNLQLPGKATYTVLLMTANGTVLQKRVVKAGTKHLELFNLQKESPGIYFIRVISAGGTDNIKIVVQR
jgi:hypothetical protein